MSSCVCKICAILEHVSDWHVCCSGKCAIWKHVYFVISRADKNDGFLTCFILSSPTFITEKRKTKQNKTNRQMH